MNEAIVNQIKSYVKDGKILPGNTEHTVIANVPVNLIARNEDHPHRPVLRKKELVDNWDIEKVGVPSVIFNPSRCDGYVFEIGNGNNRLAAAREKQQPFLSAEIKFGLAFERQCEVIGGWNDQKGFTTKHDFNVKIKMGDPLANQINELIKKHGFVLSFAHGSRKELQQTNLNILGNPGTILKVAALGGSLDVLDETLRMIKEFCKVEGSTKGVVEKEAMETAFFHGLAMTIQRCNGDKCKLVKIEQVLGAKVAGVIVSESTSKYNLKASSGKKPFAVRDYLCDLTGIPL